MGAAAGQGGLAAGQVDVGHTMQVGHSGQFEPEDDEELKAEALLLLLLSPFSGST